MTADLEQNGRVVTLPSMDLPPGYRELAPPENLRNSLACLWTRVTPADGDAVRVMPDGCVDLVWRAGLGAFVAGPDTAARLSATPPGSVTMGARFLPGAGGPALALPLSELRDVRVDLADLWHELDEQLEPTLDPDVALRRIAETAARLAAGGPPDAAVRRATHLLADPRARVETLADELGFSERQLRRRFHNAVGYGPKTLQRVLRFRRFVARAHDGDLARIAVDAGYADQAHLTRECVRLAGLTPAQLALDSTG
jgi:AraC-like DNA-binding protein